MNINQAAFREIFSACPGAYIVLQPDPPRYTIVVANKAYCEVTGTSEAELIGKGLFEAFPPNPKDPTATGVANVSASLQMVISTGLPHKMEIQRYDIPARSRADYEVRYWQPENIPVKNDEGEVAYILHTAADVTALVESEQKMKEARTETYQAEERYRYLFNHNPLPVLIFDFGSLEIIEVNEAALKKYGYKRDEFLEKSIRDHMPPEDVPELEAITRDEKAYSQVSKKVWRHLKKSGEVMYMNFTGNIIQYEGRQCVLTLLHDVTDNVLAEQKLQQNHAFLLKVTEKVPVGIYKFTMTPGGEMSISFISEWVERIFPGNTAGALMNNPFLAFKAIHPSDSGEFYKSIVESKEKLSDWKLDFRVMVGDDEFLWIRGRSTPEKEEDGTTVWYGYLQDITQTVEREEEEQLINSIINSLQSSEFIGEGLEKVLELMAGYLGFQLGEVWFAEPAQSQLELKALWPKNEKLNRIYHKSQKISMNEGLPGLTWKSKKIEWWEDLGNNKYFLSSSLAKEFGLSTGMAVPVHIKEVPIAVFVFFGQGKVQHREKVVQLAGRVSDQIALNIGRTRAEDMLIRALEDNTRILESITDGFFAVDKDWKVTYWNKEAEKLLGTRKEEIVGKELWHVFEEAAGLKFGKEYTKAMTQGVVVHFEEYFPPLLAWFEVSAYPSEKGLSVYFKDITERKAIDEKIKEANERYELVARATNDAVWDWNILTDKLLWGDGFKTLYGYEPEAEDPSLDSWISHIHPDDAGGVVESIMAVVKNKAGYYWSMEYRYLKADGTLAWVIDRGVVIRNNAGKALRMIGAMQDVTALKETEKKLMAERNLLRTLIDNIPDYIYVKDLQLRHRINNMASVKLLGASTEKETLGKTAYDYVTHQLAAGYEKDDRMVLESGQTVHNRQEYIFDPNGNKKWLSTTKVPLRNEMNEVTGLLGISRDVTHQYLQEQALLELNEELLIRANELNLINKELEQFAYVASHDLQEPLRMVTSFLGQLQKKYQGQLDDKAQQYIYYAVDGAQRMRRIITDLLDYSRVSRMASEIGKIDLNELMKEVLILNNHAIKENKAAIKVAHLPVVLGSRGPLMQVLQNLLGNALKYRTPDLAPSIKVSSSEDNHYWQVCVSDNGIGIDPKFHEKIFVLFQRLHGRQEYEGTGIGLAICKKIVDNHGGRIWVESDGKKGSTFCFTIKKGER